MKLFKIWTYEKGKVIIDGEEKEVVCYGGSNASIEEARSPTTGVIHTKEKVSKEFSFETFDSPTVSSKATITASDM